MGSSSGDGGAEAQRLREEEGSRNYQIAQDKAKINALFGITDYDYETLPDNPYEASTPKALLAGQDADLARLQELTDAISATDAARASGSDFMFENSPGAAEQKYRENVASRDALQRTTDAFVDPTEEYGPVYDPVALASQAEENAATRNATLTGIYDDILGKHTFELDKQFDRKGADVLAMLAKRGLSRSTVGQTTFDRLGEIYDTQEADFERGAGDAVTNIRRSDDTTRTNLIDMINAGGDFGNARTTALSSLDTNIAQGTKEANARDMTRLFRDMDELYGQKQYVDAYNVGQRQGSSNLVTPGSGSSTSGTVLNY